LKPSEKASTPKELLPKRPTQDKEKEQRKTRPINKAEKKYVK
jgi:hypothetical protein